MRYTLAGDWRGYQEPTACSFFTGTSGVFFMRKVFGRTQIASEGGSCEQGYTLQHTSFWHVRVGIGLNGVDLCHGERPVILQIGGQLLVCQPGKSQVDNLPEVAPEKWSS